MERRKASAAAAQAAIQRSFLPICRAPYGVLPGVDVNNNQALECPLQCLAFALPPVVHRCQDANLSQADNADQRSWLAVDQVVRTENPLADLSPPYQVNDHAGIEKEQLGRRCQ